MTMAMISAAAAAAAAGPSPTLGKQHRRFKAAAAKWPCVLRPSAALSQRRQQLRGRSGGGGASVVAAAASRSGGGAQRDGAAAGGGGDDENKPSLAKACAAALAAATLLLVRLIDKRAAAAGKQAASRPPPPPPPTGPPARNALQANTLQKTKHNKTGPRARAQRRFRWGLPRAHPRADAGRGRRQGVRGGGGCAPSFPFFGNNARCLAGPSAPSVCSQGMALRPCKTLAALR